MSGNALCSPPGEIRYDAVRYLGGYARGKQDVRFGILECLDELVVLEGFVLGSNLPKENFIN